MPYKFIFFLIAVFLTGCGGGGGGESTTQTTTENKYPVVYNANGSASGNVPVDANTYSHGQIVTVLGNSGGLVRPGFSFSGWNTKADLSGTHYSQGQTLTMSPSQLMLYANWTQNPTFLLHYDGNGSHAGEPPSDSTHYETGQTATVQGNTGNLVRTGYTFSSWNTQADGGGTTYTLNQTLNIGSASITLYAMWTLLPIPSTPASTEIDSGSLTAVTQLNVDSRRIISSPDISLQVTETASNSYSIHLSGGQLPGNQFFSDLVLADVSAPFYRTIRTLGGFTVNEHLALAKPPAKPGDTFGATVQTISGFDYVGMGNWKYLGPYQAGYWTGNKVATGSFVFGDQTPSSAIDDLPTHTYLGFAQAAGEAYIYTDSYDQLSANASVKLDRTTGEVTVIFTNPEYRINSVWMNSALNTEKIESFMSGSPIWVFSPQSLSCIIPILPASNSFSCDVVSEDADGKITGKYFGPNGENIAGTFAFTGIFGQSVAGSFMAKRQ